jgi:hypothetical protein
LGGPKSGLSASANGWDIGADVHLFVGREDQDRVDIYLTTGSNGGGRSVHLGQWERDGDGFRKVGE